MKLQAETNTSVYVTVTEEWYGGLDAGHERPNPIHVFTTEEDAKAFAASYSRLYNVDVVVTKSSEFSLSDDCDDGTFTFQGDE